MLRNEFIKKLKRSRNVLSFFTSKVNKHQSSIITILKHSVHSRYRRMLQTKIADVSLPAKGVVIFILIVRPASLQLQKL